MATDLLKALNIISAFHNYNSWIFRNIQPYLSGAVVDVGSGIGDITKYYKEHKTIAQVVLTDSHKETLIPLRERFGTDPFYRIVPMDIADRQTIPQKLYSFGDCVTCINVLEHIENEQEALDNIRRLLKPHGRVVLMVPAIPSIYGTLDRLVGHHRRYTKTRLNSILEASGFMIQHQFYMNLFGIVSWFVAGRILKYQSFDHRSAGQLDRMVPIFEKIETILKPMWGQSLITVCSKN